MTQSYTMTTLQHGNSGKDGLNGLAAALKVAIGRGCGSVGTIDPITRLWDGILPLQGYSEQAYLVQGSQFMLRAGSDRVPSRRDLFRVGRSILGHQLDGLELRQRSGRERCKGISSTKN